jgi:hypothetical protein
MPTPQPPHSSSRALAVVAVVAIQGCTPGRPVVIAPVADPGGTATELEEATRLGEPLQINFEWRLNEDRQRHRGVGVTQVEPPYRARLDLFTHDLESVLTAVLIDGDLRLPPGSREDILPPTDLMWAALGVIRPHGVDLLGVEELEGGATRLRYAYEDGTELHYEVVGGMLRSAELLDDEGRVVQWVRVDMEGAGRYPVEATYRNLTAFRELTIERRTLQSVEPFPPDTWDLAP